MTKDEALKLALEALKQIDEAMPFPVAKLAQAAIKEALAQRTWVNATTWRGLTDEEQKTISDLASANDWHDFDVMDATETKLKEKNND